MRTVLVARRGSKDLVQAELHDDLSVQDLFLAERSWTPDRASIMADLRRRGVPTAQWPQSLHWNWMKKADDLRLQNTKQYGIFGEGRWQALMMSKTEPYRARLAPNGGKNLVYIDYVETAPWNWKIEAIEQKGDFLALGSTLLKAAVEQSLREEFRGRVGLHALPQAENFYCGIGMTRMEPDPNKQNLVYFEFSKESAEQFLTKGTRP